MKRTYRFPLSSPTEVAFEQSLLVATARLLIQMDELDNMNILEEGSTSGAPDAPGGEMYLEF